jgi:competence protein ComEA
MIIRYTQLLAASWCALAAGALHAQLPDGPGRDATMEVCGKCHDPGIVANYHQDRQAWTDMIQQMIEKGAEGSEAQFKGTLDYLVKNFGPAAAPVNVNKAGAKELQTAFEITPAEAGAIVKYRDENGAFKEIGDLKKVPKLDYKKIEAKKDRIVF